MTGGTGGDSSDGASYAVEATSHFEGDLTRAYRYYVEQAGPGGASGFLDEYDLTVTRLQAMPTATVSIGETGLRWCPVGSFVAVFSIESARRVVTLQRLFYMSADWRRRILESGGLE